MDAKLVVIGGKATHEKIRLKLPTIVGREQGAGLVVAHPTVSRKHCEIFELNGGLVVRDLGSGNGTFIGKNRITEALLPPGQEFTVGPLTFRAEYQTELDLNESTSLDDLKAGLVEKRRKPEKAKPKPPVKKPVKAAEIVSDVADTKPLDLDLPAPAPRTAAVVSPAAPQETDEFDFDLNVPSPADASPETATAPNDDEGTVRFSSDEIAAPADDELDLPPVAIRGVANELPDEMATVSFEPEATTSLDSEEIKNIAFDAPSFEPEATTAESNEAPLFDPAAESESEVDPEPVAEVAAPKKGHGKAKSKPEKAKADKPSFFARLFGFGKKPKVVKKKGSKAGPANEPVSADSDGDSELVAEPTPAFELAAQAEPAAEPSFEPVFEEPAFEPAAEMEPLFETAADETLQFEAGESATPMDEPLFEDLPPAATPVATTPPVETPKPTKGSFYPAKKPAEPVAAEAAPTAVVAKPAKPSFYPAKPTAPAKPVPEAKPAAAPQDAEPNFEAIDDAKPAAAAKKTGDDDLNDFFNQLGMK